MIYSMTGFARHTIKGEWGSATWEIRSVNHRYCDISVKLPESFRECEPAIRRAIQAKISRGKIEALLKFSPSADVATGAMINHSLLHQLTGHTATLQRAFHQDVTVNAVDLLRWPGLLEDTEVSLSQLQQPILDGLEDAIDKLKDMRQQEGQAILAMLTERLVAISEIVTVCRSLQPLIKTRYREALLEKLSEVKEQLDQDRLEQEMVYFSQKIDVAEELDRLDAHVSEINNVLQRDDAVGRRLDFFMQELNREANTLSSKSQDQQQTHASVDLKVLIEQMREQVQNIE
ncbi:MAG: YicC family protein [Coxiellaceae bacterium]|nr:YicC family protein [Coxiellaceae bacterium]